MRSRFRAILVCVLAWFCGTAAAAPSLIFFGQIQAANPSLVDFFIRAEGLPGGGLAGVHVDFAYDQSTVTLVSASAGEFYALNGALGSVWTDTVSAGLLQGDAVVSSVTDATTAPDVLGFELLEVAGVAAVLDGELLRLVFNIGSAGAAQFSVNDVILIDGLGLAMFQTGQTVTIGAVNPVPEPSALALALLGLGLMTISRRR